MNSGTINKDLASAGKPVGRFAPSPSGRMHLGNLSTALLSWLSAKSRGGKWILRIEDIDPQRSKDEFADLIREDLAWLGLSYDEEYRQSDRFEIYEEYFRRLTEMGLTYRCHCRRADIMATQAPHRSDGRIVYSGACRPSAIPPFPAAAPDEGGATRLWVPDREISFNDRICGQQTVNLAEYCGDFIIRRADGAWAYQLAVVVDDALMGVTEVLRGDDLILSTAQQLYLYELLGFAAPEFAHIPLVRNSDGQRLSKRDKAESLEELRSRYSPEEVLGRLAQIAGLREDDSPVSSSELLKLYKQTH